MTHKEALTLALEAFEAIPEEIEGWIPDKCTDAAIAIKEALAQPEQEPVAIVIEVNKVGAVALRMSADVTVGTRLYTTPPQRTWVGLTDEDWDYLNKYCGSTRSAVQTAETLLKEKNT